MVQTPSRPYFKGLDMRKLQYEIRICQKSHKKVTITVYLMVRFLMKHTLLVYTVEIFNSPRTLKKGTKGWKIHSRSTFFQGTPNVS